MFKNLKEELDYEIKRLFKDERIAYYRYQAYEAEGLKVVAFVDSESAKEMLRQFISDFSAQIVAEIKVLGEDLPENLQYASWISEKIPDSGARERVSLYLVNG